MTGDVDLATAAALLHRSTSWLQRHWRTLAHAETGEAFPPPFVGAERGGRPWWRRARLEAWLDGRPWGEAAGGFAQRPAAHDTLGPWLAARGRPIADNDPAPLPVTDRAAALIRAAGG